MFILNLFILLYFWKLIQFIVFYAVCSGLTASPPQSPFQCLDLVYISVLLQELGFPPTKQFKVRNTRVQDLGQSLGQRPGSRARVWARVQDLTCCVCVLQLARTINEVETSWALGATFHYIESLKRHWCFYCEKLENTNILNVLSLRPLVTSYHTQTRPPSLCGAWHLLVKSRSPYWLIPDDVTQEPIQRQMDTYLPAAVRLHTHLGLHYRNWRVSSGAHGGNTKNLTLQNRPLKYHNRVASPPQLSDKLTLPLACWRS